VLLTELVVRLSLRLRSVTIVVLCCAVAGTSHPELLPCGYLVGDNNRIIIRLKGTLQLVSVSFSVL